ncbi:MAG TPA: chromosome partitioning protein ParB [Firmicutes bacterium]|jgi:ParB family chromosome partitioning protein|nr:chromosome partitioning protein ParB [Bacillota bacterium]HBK59847.1 chromosome partitioning protein ParB [Bacillota bacterium]
MAAKPRGLGKGLSAIIGADTVGEVVDRSRGVEIPIDRLSSNPFQPRRSFADESIQQLAESIRLHGILQPVVVRPAGDGYQLIAGERRWRAAQIVGLPKIPAIVRELDDSGMVQVALIENLQREDLNPIEEALAYRKLMGEFKMTQEQLSKSIGRSRPVIANTVRLLNLPAEIQNHVEEKRLSEGHARCLLAISDEALQLKVAAKIIADGLNVRQAEELVKVITQNVSRETIRQRTASEDPDAAHLAQRLSEKLGTKVKLSGSASKGRLEIAYYSPDDLDRILEIILGRE